MQAAGRLAVLSRQLGVAANETELGIAPQYTYAETEQRPAPAGGKGTLSVIDNRTGKKYTVRSWALLSAMQRPPLPLPEFSPAAARISAMCLHNLSYIYCSGALYRLQPCRVSSRMQPLHHAHTLHCTLTPSPPFASFFPSITTCPMFNALQLEVSEGGTIAASALKQITAGGDGVGLRAYDPGYTNTSAVISRISYIDGDRGILRYRGYPIEQLADRSTFLEVHCYALVTCAYCLLLRRCGWRPVLSSTQMSVPFDILFCCC